MRDGFCVGQGGCDEAFVGEDLGVLGHAGGEFAAEF